MLTVKVWNKVAPKQVVTKKISFQDRKKQNTQNLLASKYWSKFCDLLLVASLKIVFTGRKFVVMYATNHPHLLKQWEWKSLAKNLGVTPERVGRTNAKCFKIERERRDAASFARKKTLLLATYWVGVSVSSRAIKQPISHAVNACLDRTEVYSSLFEVVSLWLYRNHISAR